MLNEGFLKIAKMVLGICIVTSLKVVRPTSLLGYTGPPFIPFNVLCNQPLNKMSRLPSSNAAAVWSSHTLVGNVQDGSASCLVRVSAVPGSPRPSVSGAAASSMYNSERYRTVAGEFFRLLLGQMVSHVRSREHVIDWCQAWDSVAKSHVMLGCADEIET